MVGAEIPAIKQTPEALLQYDPKAANALEP